jgi:tRNA nucleotidyltransferase (CCA-adding enzyme)
MFKLNHMSKAYWEHFEHKADIGVRGYGSTLEKSFEQAAIAMTAVITDVSRVQTAATISISCSDDDNETLLYDWLNALIYEMATRKMLFSKFTVTIDQCKLTAIAAGEAIDIERHQPSVEIKGATYTELAVHQQGELWLAQCVIDV